MNDERPLPGARLRTTRPITLRVRTNRRGKWRTDTIKDIVEAELVRVLIFDDGLYYLCRSFELEGVKESTRFVARATVMEETAPGDILRGWVSPPLRVSGPGPSESLRILEEHGAGQAVYEGLEDTPAPPAVASPTVPPQESDRLRRLRERHERLLRAQQQKEAPGSPMQDAGSSGDSTSGLEGIDSGG